MHPRNAKQSQWNGQDQRDLCPKSLNVFVLPTYFIENVNQEDINKYKTESTS